ncbi:hypothetical protein [Gordonia sp. MP11Mi]
MSEESAVKTPATAPSDVVSSIRGFVSANGGSAKAVLQAAGQAGVRVTLVGDNGTLGDRVVDDMETAKAVVDAVDGLETAEWDRELTSAADVRPGHWQKMAGWVANQKRFPKARNRKILD